MCSEQTVVTHGVSGKSPQLILGALTDSQSLPLPCTCAHTHSLVTPRHALTHKLMPPPSLAMSSLSRKWHVWGVACRHTHLLAGEELLNQGGSLPTLLHGCSQGLAQPMVVGEDREAEDPFSP